MLPSGAYESWKIEGRGDTTFAAAPPDGDGVPVARQQLLHVEVSRDLLQDETHVRVQVVHGPHLVADADGGSQRVGQRPDQFGTVVII